MRDRNPVCWLMTDERIGDALWPALLALPPGSGVVFRHHATPARERRALLKRVRRIARARRLVLTIAGESHNARRTVTASAHDRREAVAAVRAGAAWVFVSPVYPTRSHPDAHGIGPSRAAGFVRGLPVKAVALGGMDARRWRRMRGMFDGWAGIDAFALPTMR